MMIYDNQDATASAPADPMAMSADEFADILKEIQEQPTWRAKADKEADYIDGNQLDTALMKKQASLGIPPASENIMKSAIESVMGFEAKTRKDWRLSSDNGSDGHDVAAALGYKLNQAERQSGADKACSDAFRTQFCLGIGWVEVARESDPFAFPYRCAAVPLRLPPLKRLIPNIAFLLYIWETSKPRKGYEKG